MAMEPTAEKPVRNFPASTHLRVQHVSEHCEHKRGKNELEAMLEPQLQGLPRPHPLANVLPPYEPLSMPPKNSIGIGTSTYMNAVSIGHQLCHSRHPRSCSSTPRLKLKARAPAECA